MQELIKQAIKQYDAFEAKREKENSDAQKADEEAAVLERYEMLEFLSTLMPQDLVQYADLKNYRREHARRFRSDDSNGTMIHMRVPGCFPVRLRVWADHDGDLRHEPERWSQSGPKFTVPTLASVRVDEYGDDGYYIRFDGSESFDDFMTALGYAAVRGVELIPLQQEIEQRKADDEVVKQIGPKVEVVEKTTEDRMVTALEEIATVLDAMLTHKVNFG